ncbi:chalcone isomerase family protein [Crocinitomicaceae bacterium]|nr:chalcone isomerase family protein [Crocinitomicaceae bacterium]MDA9161138.1 chalcone isomerase family protein [Crocinitomicaceae bacterium]
MKTLFISLLMLCMTSVSSAQGRKISGVTFPPEMDLKGTSLFFNGCGLRSKIGIDLYVAGLYLKKPTMDENKAIKADEVQAIKIVIVSSKVTRDKFNDAVKEGFENASPFNATTDQIKSFKSFFAAPFKVNDEINMIYKPGKGTLVTINGQFKGIIKGLPFKKALFAIWLGNKPAQGKLKKGMMGQI